MSVIKRDDIIRTVDGNNDKIARMKVEILSKDLPVLQEVANSIWRKENELKELKTELSALDRKIQLSLKPADENEGKPAEKPAEKHANSPQPQQLPEQLQRIKEAMGGRLVVGSVPRYKDETQPKSIRL